VLEAGALAYCCPVTMELIFERLLPEILVFKVKKGPFFFQIGLFCLFEETHVSLQRQPSVLEE
jgi:hypothetical protein